MEVPLSATSNGKGGCHMDMTASWRHLFSAVLTLGVSEGTVYERLEASYRGALRNISAEGLPAHVRSSYSELMRELNAFFHNSSQHEVKAKTASRLAKQVMELYDTVAKELK